MMGNIASATPQELQLMMSNIASATFQLQQE
jgi:hypothetical protein